MARSRILPGSFLAAALAWAAAAAPAQLAPEVQAFVRHDAPTILLTHVRIIDGLGNPPQADRNVVIEDGRIKAITPGADAAPGPGRAVLDLRGATVLPGLVGMHDHLFHIARPNLRPDGSYDAPLVVPQMTYSSPRLYLAAGVTTIRTAGSVEPFAHLNLKRLVDLGRLPGPRIEVTAPYLEGPDSPFIQMQQLKDPQEARRMVEYWAERGATSFKAYTHITRAELGAAIEAAHARGLKVTGHLDSVTYPEAAALGIDNLEHGFFVNTQLDPGKQPDRPSPAPGFATLMAMDPGGKEARDLIALLVAKRVAVTSTLPVFEHNVPNRPRVRPLALEVLAPEAREAWLLSRNRLAARPPEQALAAFRRGMALERAFAAAGGLLVAGCDPTGNGGTIPGISDWREVELLVEAGFTPVEAIRVATHNGALFLGLQDRIGAVAPGLEADLVVVRGNPAERIEDLENVEEVFKGGIGYDSAKLFQSARGTYGRF